MADIPVTKKGTAPWLWLWLVLGLLGLGLLIWLAVSLLGNNRADSTSPPAAGTAAAGTVANATIAEITRSPSAYYGKTVTVSGEITDVVSTRAIGVNQDLLVVSRQDLRNGQGQPFQTGVVRPDPVRVTGTVREFNITAIERELGADLDDNKFTRWAGKPVIVATSVQAGAQATTGTPAAATPAGGRR